ncbi:SH3 domain-containing protein [Pleurotus pulmonarius]
MVFTNLGAHEKDAFFSLLDEYFASRPEIFAKLSNSKHGSDAATSEATSKMVTAGLRHVPKSSPYHAAASNPHVSSAIGKVAAASLAFNRSDTHEAQSTPPPAPPRRSPDPSAAASEHKPPLPTTRRFGDVDTSSAKNMFTSLRNSTANKSYQPPPPPAPSAFGPKKNTFAPPPVRRVSDNAAEVRNSPPPPPPPAPRPPPIRQQDTGEWAEVIYDYTGDDPGDLSMEANQRIKIVEHTSEDWWTGEINGKRGLFPASYVKVV